MTTTVTRRSTTPDRIGSQCVPLTAGPEAPSQARRAASTYLRRTCPSLDPDRCDDVLLIVSELVTNAVRYTPGPRTLTLTTTAHSLDIAVTDTSCRAPAPRAPDLTDGTGGMGLHIADDLGARIFTEPLPDGKCVHAALDRT
ncbi:histidine kinase-like protein [Streptomyces sp. KhCrAH-43]|uniref:ATP-binding protein n=1 Tax=Streptomyces TaxID=1883 RepID=UPI0003AA5A03|nr:ATP-binding protein [Streptomyces sp. SID4920]MYX68494.1 ATP-binding protein [Streptomyces sp. SID8373]RAJ49556.1 histidine kinase-like protein [Streptomyces sp. KhCrAH-43]